MPINKRNRALIVVNSLAARGEPKYEWLYEFCENSGVLLAETLLRPHYNKYRKLVAPKATKRDFMSALSGLGSDTVVAAIDVILMLHGSPNKLHFDDAEVNTTTLRNEVAALNLRNKLRMLYSTCCYGDSHSDDFVAGGFRAAVGSLGVNANAATEYPTVLTMWAAGIMLKDAVAAGENPWTREPQDQLARSMGFSDANSDKNIRGNGRITITSASA